jgi:uncharacterized SAM-binding protein YcdF (DUF218 family)
MMFVDSWMTCEEAMELTPDEIRKITEYLDATTPLPDHADLLFVVGSKWITSAHLAADLYRRNIAPYVVLTGGDNRYTGENEANAHCSILLEAGVPADRMIVENRSTNTLENVTFALPLIEPVIPLASIKTVLVVVKWMHSRRAVMTLKKHMPRGIRYYVHTFEPNGVTRDNWHLNPRAESANVLKNWERIPQYLEWGHLEEVIRDGDSYI